MTEMKVRLISSASRKWEISQYCSNVYSVKWSPDGRFLATSCHEIIRIFYVNGSEFMRIDPAHYHDWVHSLSWGPEGKFAIFIGSPLQQFIAEPVEYLNP